MLEHCPKLERCPTKTSAPGRPEPRYASVTDFGQMVGLSRDYIYLLLRRGDLIGVKPGKRTLVDVQQGLAWIASQPAYPTQQAA